MIPEITYDIKDRIMTVTLNRPEKKNAITAAMYGAMANALKAADDDAGVRVVVITGAGEAFTAGNDLMDFQNNPPRGDDTPVAHFLRQIATMQKPIVAAVNGVAVGVGLTMLLHFDLIYMAESATISAPFVDLALVPEAASSLLLTARVGHARASEIFMLGKRVSAHEAVQMGLANAALPAGDLLPTAYKVAAMLAAKAPESIRQTKGLMRRDREAVLSRMAEESDLFSKRLHSEELKEAITAFWEKRPPNFA